MHRGPNEAVLVGSDRPIVNATGLTKGEYVFRLTAWDDVGTSGNDTVNVKVIQSKRDNSLGIISGLSKRIIF